MSCDVFKYDYAGTHRAIVSADFQPDFSGIHAADDMFSGLLTFTGVGGCSCTGTVGPGSGIIERVQIIEIANNPDTLQNPDGVLYLFRSQPGSVAAKNAAFTYTLNTPGDLIAVIPVGSAYEVVPNTDSNILQAVSNEPVLNTPYISAGNVLWGLMSITNTPTYTVANSVHINLSVTKD